ncbi:hypothetical protein [Hymenobacter sp. PAMC 26628]|uniref:hypothetical protein n=1 Tax=Hymenobacter sp. PAMC 26628 TaxID=1484118 RepID=UPI0007703D81|nr:hypothetical protein [Hymenobacter sp. PAMC 26628]AMJ64342.1 hypothetical protein AXW84_02040 [Hymenobacter sp. PAMC 26628]
MTVKTLVLLAVAALATAACAQEKEAENTAASSAYLPTNGAPAAAISALDTMRLRNDADVAAMRVARDLQITDPALLTRIKNEYYARGRALQGYSAQYAADTAGEYAAVRATNEQTSRRLKAAFTPRQYQAYASRQAAYYAPPRAAAVAPVAGHPAALAMPRPGTAKLPGAKGRYQAPGARVTFQKVKYANGVKVKRNFDGSLKIKRADGTIVKFDKNGHRTVKKSLF